MTKRKKRLKKGIVSLAKQITIHEDKLERAKAEGAIEIASYYQKELIAKKKDLEKKEKLLRKQ